MDETAVAGGDPRRRKGLVARSTTVTYAVLVAAPVADTWRYLTDFTTMPQWARGVESIVEISPGPVRVGTKVVDVGYGIKRRWPETFWVDELEEEKTLGLVWKGSYGTAHVRYTMRPEAEGTVLTGHTYGHYRFPFSLLLAFMGRTANDNFRAGLESIRDQVQEAYGSAGGAQPPDRGGTGAGERP